MNRTILLPVLLASTLLITACTPPSVQIVTPTSTSQSTKVQLGVGYIPSVQFAPLYAAIEKGYFADENIERLQLEVAARYGFHMLQHRMDIYGLCSHCLSKRRRLIPLTMAKPGERVVIREISGGRTRRARLASMGLRPGDIIEIIANTGQGRIILGHEDTRLAIGRGIAQVIVVSLAEEGEND